MSEQKSNGPEGEKPQGAPAKPENPSVPPARGANVHQAKKQTLMMQADPEALAALKKGLAEASAAKAPPQGAPADGSAPDAVSVAGATSGEPSPPVAAETGDVRVRYFGLTDVGLVREHNEDNFIVADLEGRVRGTEGETPREAVARGLGTLLAVCDGMGGAAAGEVASQMAVDTLYDILTSWEPTRDRDAFARRLVGAIDEAGRRIFAAAKMDRSRRGMGTTSTVAGLMDKVLFIGQVGDSRAYLKRGAHVALITKDQSLVNQLIEAGQLTEEEAEAFEHSNIILQALGTTEDVQVDLTFLELRKGDRLLLCSDGLSGLVHPELIADVLSTTPDLPSCARKLVDMANAGGGHDNITVVCADFDGEGLSAPDADSPPLYQQYPLPPSVDGTDSLPARGAKVNPSAPRLDETTPPSVSSLLAQGASSAHTPPTRWQGSLFVGFFVAAILGTLAIATLMFLQSTGRQYVPPPVRKALELGTPTVPVRIVAEMEGDLYIDGRWRAPLYGGNPVSFRVPLGPRRFEVRSGGMVLATVEKFMVRGTGNEVVLALPEAPVGDGGVVAPAEGSASTDRGEETQGAAARPEAPAPAREPAPRTPVGGGESGAASEDTDGAPPTKIAPESPVAPAVPAPSGGATSSTVTPPAPKAPRPSPAPAPPPEPGAP